MEQNKKILIKFLLYVFTCFLIMLIGISKIFADEIDVGYITNKTTISYENNNAQAMVSLPVQTNVNSYLYNLLSINISNQNILANNIYLLELYTPNAKLQNINEVHIVDSSSNVCQFFGTSDFSIGYPKIYFKCNQATNNLTITLNNTNPSTLTSSITTGNNFQWNYAYLKYFTEDDDIDLGPIISNQTQNTQDIINNNNSNTQKIIDSNKENFQTCRNSVNLFNKNNANIINVHLANSTTISGNSNSNRSLYISIEPNTTYTISRGFTGNPFVVGTTQNIPTANSSYSNRKSSQNGKSITITTGENDNYLIVWFWNNNDSPFSQEQILNTLQIEKGSTATEYESYGEEICVNKLDEQNKTSKGILGKLKDLFDTLFSDDDADITGLNNMVGWLPPGPVDSIINLPLAFFNSLTNTLTGTCHSVSLPIPFVNQTLVLPCFDAYMSQYLTGFNTLWTLVGTILSVFILYYYLLSLYKWVDDTLTFRENNLPGYYGDNWGGGA